MLTDDDSPCMNIIVPSFFTEQGPHTPVPQGLCHQPRAAADPGQRQQLPLPARSRFSSQKKAIPNAY